MDNLTSETKEPPIDFNNTAATVTLIIVAGVFLIYKTYTDAKYNRETICSYDENNGFVFASRPATTNNMAVCPV